MPQSGMQHLLLPRPAIVVVVVGLVRIVVAAAVSHSCVALAAEYEMFAEGRFQQLNP